MIATGIAVGIVFIGTFVVLNMQSGPKLMKGKLFESSELGMAFEYPAEWTGDMVKDPSGVALFANSACTEKCANLFVQHVAKEQHDYTYRTILNDDFKIPQKLDPSRPPTAAESASVTLPTQTDKGEFLAVAELPDPQSGLSTLKIYNKKDRIYLFQLINPTSTLTDATTGAAAEATAIFDLITATFHELPIVAKEFPTISKTGAEFRFACGDLDSFRAQPFFDDFTKKVEGLNLYRTAGDISSRGFMKASVTDVSQICYSKEGNVMIGILSSREYCVLGNIVRYNTQTGVIEYADESHVLANTNCMSLTEFGKRNGTVIGLKGGFGDAGMFQEATFDYGYNENVLRVNQVCSGDAAQPEKKTCKSF